MYGSNAEPHPTILSAAWGGEGERDDKGRGGRDRIPPRS